MAMRGWSRSAIALVMTVTASCVSSGVAPPARGSADLITQEELEKTDVSNLHQAIQRLRPNWLHSRGQVSITNRSAGDPVVYLEETRLGGLSTLGQLSVTEIREVRRLSAGEATNRFGTGHAGGAIVVTRRTGRE